MIWPNFMRLSIPFSYPEYIFSVMQSHLSQSANDLICLLLINDMSFLKPVLGSLPTVFIYQVNCASFGGGSGLTFNTLQCWKRRRGWGWRGSHESDGGWGQLRPRGSDASGVASCEQWSEHGGGSFGDGCTDCARGGEEGDVAVDEGHARAQGRD